MFIGTTKHECMVDGTMAFAPAPVDPNADLTGWQQRNCAALAGKYELSEVKSG